MKGHPERLLDEPTVHNRVARHASRIAGCVDPQARAFLLPYTLSKCSDTDSFEFEVHLLACAACFRDLKQLDRAGSILKDLGVQASPALEQPSRPPPNKRNAKR